MSREKLYNKCILDYAYKFIADSKEDPTIDNMKRVFSNCIRMPKEYMYSDIAIQVAYLKIKDIYNQCVNS